MGNAITDKLKSAVAGGGDVNAEHALKVLRADEFRLLEDYFLFEPRDLKLTADMLPDGSVTLAIQLKAKGFREAGRTLD